MLFENVNPLVYDSSMPEPLESFVNAIARKFSISPDTAFEILVISLILDKPFDEVYSDIWTGGSHDCGIDGAYIDVPSNTIWLFQSKNASSLKDTEITAFLTSYQQIFAQNNSAGHPMNPKLTAVLNDYQNTVKGGVVLEPKLYFAYSGSNTDPAHANNAAIASRFSATPYPPLSIVDVSGLMSKAAALQKTHRDEVRYTFRAEETNITPFSNQALYSFSIGNVRAVNFRMAAVQLCELMTEEIGVNGSVDTLFTENIRGYLKRNKTNKRINETLHSTSESPFFSLMNNGITIICSSVTIPGSSQAGVFNIPVIDPVIVNGLQTSKVIYEVFNEDRNLLRDVFVTVRVYETRDPVLIDLITEATNTQTAINYRDQMSNKPFNHHSHTYFAGRNVRYVSKRGESIREPSLSAGLSDAVTNELVIKFWYATYNQDPHRAKTSKTGLLEDIFSATKETHPVFGDKFLGAQDSPIYEELFNAYRIYKFVSDKRIELRGTAGSDYLVHSDELMAFGIYRSLQTAGLLSSFTEANLVAHYTDVNSRISSLVEYERLRRGTLYSHSNYFKSEGIVEDYLQAETDPSAFVIQPTLLGS